MLWPGRPGLTRKGKKLTNSPVVQLPRFGPYEFRPLSTTRLDLFECDAKLERYFREDALDSENELIAKHFFVHHDDLLDIPLVGLSLSNNAIEACPEVDMTLVRSAQYRVYPAVLIGRFAAHQRYQGLSKPGL